MQHIPSEALLTAPERRSQLLELFHSPAPLSNTRMDGLMDLRARQAEPESKAAMDGSDGFELRDDVDLWVPAHYGGRLVTYEKAREIVSLLDLNEHDKFYDLGSGFGHVVLTAALMSGAECVGVELAEWRVERAQHATQTLELPNASFILGDVREVDFTDATAIFTFQSFPYDVQQMIWDRCRDSRSETPTKFVVSAGTPLTEDPSWVTPPVLHPGQKPVLKTFESLPL